ncbi:stage VI sporulation protein D [Pseudalkalibacillus sp. R45]|uniref:stage VI sporulation protein D n=1 Tax=Pseudalkalibacillus sp. R45 TaxID=3457433 RepID=UPI003FCD180F
MTERNQSKLQFSIEESVWLNKGQEVEELYSVALDPDVTIEEVDDQICIKGFLCLTGEYRCADQDDEEPSTEDSNFLGYRSFSQLNEVSDDVVKLDHRFPVDITLPKNRVHDKDELYVTVDNFDYDMPTPSCIEVSAAVSVTGVYENQGYAAENFEDQESVYENEVYETREEEDDDDELYEGGSNPFPILEFESRRSPQSEEDENVETEYQAVRREPQVEFMSRAEEHYDRSASYEYESDMEDSDTSSFEIEYEEEETYRPEQYEYEEDDDEYYYEEESEEVYEEQAVEETSSSRPPREENALYLTKMLTRDDEELTKMKMCIIQAGDSLDSIAGRYDVPPSQLMRVNRLESEEIEEGQILYIPVSAR